MGTAGLSAADPADSNAGGHVALPPATPERDPSGSGARQGRGEAPVARTRPRLAQTDDPGDARDQALVAAHRAGDPAALGELLQGYQDRLFGICIRMVPDAETARDLTQDALVKVIQGLHQYSGRSKLSTWMIRVTMNVCLTHLRRQKLRGHASIESAGMTRGDDAGRTLRESLADRREPGAPAAVEEREVRDRMYAALADLEPHQRAMLLLRDMHRLDYRQIAEVLDVPEGTVKSRLFRARVALRERLEATGDDAEGPSSKGGGRREP